MKQVKFSELKPGDSFTTHNRGAGTPVLTHKKIEARKIRGHKPKKVNTDAVGCLLFTEPGTLVWVYESWTPSRS